MKKKAFGWDTKMFNEKKKNWGKPKEEKVSPSTKFKFKSKPNDTNVK